MALRTMRNVDGMMLKVWRKYYEMGSDIGDLGRDIVLLLTTA